MKSFVVQPFNQRVYVTDDVDAFCRKYNRHADPSDKIEAGEVEQTVGMAAVATRDDDPAVFILYLSPEACVGTYFHEALHMAHYIMRHCCQDINMESTETQAYMMEHIASLASKKLA